MKLGLPAQWRLGGLMLVVGGLASAIGATLFAAGPQLVGTWLTVVGLFLEGGGLITVSFGFAPGSIAGWVRRFLQIAGGFVVLECAVSVTQLLSPVFPATFSSVLFIAATATFLVAAVAIFRTDSLRGPIGWALLPAAVFEAIDYFLQVSGYGGAWWTLVILGVTYVVGGVVFASRTIRRVGSKS